MQRWEWILGFPQVVGSWKMKKYGVADTTGINTDDDINSAYCKHKSTLCKSTSGQTNGFLFLLWSQKGKLDNIACAGLRTLLELMNDDEVFAKYIFSQPSPTMQGARYTDWFWSYYDYIAPKVQKEAENQITLLDYTKAKMLHLQRIEELRPAVEAKLNGWIEDQKKELLDAAVGTSKFVGYREQCLYPEIAEIIPSYPPAYLIGAAA